MMQDFKNQFTAQNFHEHGKEFLRTLKIWARDLKKVQEQWVTVSSW
jgi:hypothetical protein